MPVALSNIRDELLPGLRALQYSTHYTETWAVMLPPEPVPVPLPVAAAMGAAAAVIANPVVTRRWLFGATS